MIAAGNGIDTAHWFETDTGFNKIYPPAFEKLAAKHWTPLNVARKAAKYLAAEPGKKILDIGSGVGKFCFAAAHYKSAATYYGVEQRQQLIDIAVQTKEVLGFDNVSFINGNFTQLDFTLFDHFYFYNSFYENLSGIEKIDNSIDYSAELYQYYNRYLYLQLEKMPPGTRLATFYSLEDELPPMYHIVGSEYDNLLKFWIKI